MGLTGHFAAVDEGLIKHDERYDELLSGLKRAMLACHAISRGELVQEAAEPLDGKAYRTPMLAVFAAPLGIAVRLPAQVRQLARHVLKAQQDREMPAFELLSRVAQPDPIDEQPGQGCSEQKGERLNQNEGRRLREADRHHRNDTE